MSNSNDPKEWLLTAETDLSAANKLFSEPQYGYLVAFLLQQSAEKFLKSLLITREISPPKTHDLVQLLALVVSNDPSFPQVTRECDELSKFAVSARYPGALPSPSPSHLQEAFRTVNLIRTEVVRRLHQP